jgi:hypothetical protein
VLYLALIALRSLGTSGLSRHLQQIAPMTAGMAIEATTGQ